MDYDTFLSFFDKLKEEKQIEVGDYTIEYSKEHYDMLGSTSKEAIRYYKDGYMIGNDYIHEYYRIGDIIPTINTSFEKDFGIKGFDKLIDYLDYLYLSNIDKIRNQKLEREQEIVEKQRKEQLRVKKLNDFIGLD